MSEIEKLRADVDRWHRAAMDAGVIVLADGRLSFPRDRASPVGVDAMREALVEVRKKIDLASVASCSCVVKTPDWKHHAPRCRWRLLCEADSHIDTALASAPQSAPAGTRDDGIEAAARVCTDHVAVFTKLGYPRGVIVALANAAADIRALKGGGNG